ncbi:MAG: hypothetical protein R3F56_01175 [Planctomycetota bacterium]
MTSRSLRLAGLALPTLLAVLSACRAPRATADADTETMLDAAEPASPLRLRATDADAWSRTQVDGRWVFEQRPTDRYQPRYRSPLNLAILADTSVHGDFDLEVDARQVGREYPHRDLCLVFAMRDPDHFAYAHLATQGDDTAHHVHVVDAAPRRPITTWRSNGVAWGNTWHRLRLERRGARVRVHFDDVVVLEAEPAPTADGFVGIGSFDDEGQFANLRLRADMLAHTQASFFAPLADATVSGRPRS